MFRRSRPLTSNIDDVSKTQIVIFCGGKGTRLGEVTEGLTPKPMVRIAGLPILLHIMNSYAKQGFMRFVLCVGHKSWQIKEFFLNYEYAGANCRIRNGVVDILDTGGSINIADWEILIIETGENTQTAGRLHVVSKYIDQDIFMLTYGDGVSDVKYDELVNFHVSHDKPITITGVPSPGRFGELRVLENGLAIGFEEKPKDFSKLINGGFMCVDRDFIDKYIPNAAENIMFEDEPLRNAVKNGDLMVFQHSGFWQCMDTPRDYQYLTELFQAGKF